MNLIQRLLSFGHIRRAKRALASDPSPRTYMALAQQYTQVGRVLDAQRACVEGLTAFPDNMQLARFHKRTKRAEREASVARLHAELAQAPRAGLWRELVEILIDSDELTRAEQELGRWLEREDSPEAHYLLARVRMAIFYADRGRDQGRLALASIDHAVEALPGDARPLRAKLDLLSRIGAWKDASEAAGKLLALEPGALELEGRYRTLQARASDAPTIERALHVVEQSGNLVDGAISHVGAKSGNVQPVLRELAQHPDVKAVMYLRGATALVQGPKGATAERTARAVQSVLAGSRAASRRLGLGQVFQIQLEGHFGTLSIAPGENDAGAILTTGPLGRPREEALLGMAGLNAHTEGVEA